MDSQIRFTGRAPCAAHTFGFHGIVSFTQAGGVCQPDNLSAKNEADLDHVPGRPGDVGHDGGLPPGEPVEDGRLAGVRGADDHDAESVADAFTDPAIAEGGLDLFDQAGDPFANRGGGIAADITFIRKVDHHLDEREESGQLITPLIIYAGESARDLPEGLRLLREGLRLDQVGHAFGFGEVKFARFESAPGELAGARKPDSGNCRQRIERMGDHRRPAMQVKLECVFAGIGVRGRGVEREALVDLGAGEILDPGQHRAARFRHTGCQ